MDLTGNAADENGSVYTVDLKPATHHIVAFRRGGSVTVNFGTNQWGWGLSDFHVRGEPGEDPTMQQATVNLLVDLGCPPATLQAGLVQPQPMLESWTWPRPVALSVSPSSVRVPLGSSLRFVAYAAWSNGLLTDVSDHVVWSVTGGGELLGGLLMTRPANGTAVVTAELDGTTASARADYVSPRVRIREKVRSFVRRIPVLGWVAPIVLGRLRR